MKNVHLIPTDRPSRLRIGDNGNFVFGMIQTSIQSKNDDFTNQHIYITSDASDEEIKEGDWGFKIILTTDQDLIADGIQAIDDEFLEWFVKNPSCESVEIENKKVLVGWEPDYTYEDLGIDGSKNVYHNFYKIIIPQEEPKQETLEEDDLLDTEIQVVGDNKTQSIRNFLNLSKATTKIYDEDDLRRAIEIGLNAIKDNKEIFRKGLTKKEEIDLLLQSIKQPKQETLEEAAEKLFSDSYIQRKIFIAGAKWQAERMYSEEEAKTIWKAGQEYWKTSGASITFEELTEQFKKK